MGAQIKFGREEFALSTGQSQRSNDAAVKDAQIMFKMEEYALGMEQRSNNAAVKDVQIKLRREECV